jgi:hypothetical protein
MNTPIRNATSVAYLSILEFLTLRYLPGRFCAWQTAAALGMEPQHIPVLVAARLLKPLGSPPRTAPKFFARDYVLQLAADEKWLARASDALVAHWAKRNGSKQKP